mgnify:CR=1 FL=1
MTEPDARARLLGVTGPSMMQTLHRILIRVEHRGGDGDWRCDVCGRKEPVVGFERWVLTPDAFFLCPEHKTLAGYK